MTLYQQRLTAVRAQFPTWQVEGLLITSPANRRWLSGFTGSAGKLLITADQAIIATDFRYYQQAMAECPDFVLCQHQRTAADDEKLFGSVGASTIGLEAQHVTLAEAAKLGKVAGIEWIPLDDTVEPLRAVKTPAEVEAIRAAAAITDLAMSQVNQIAKPGMTEKQLAWELEKLMREAGADSMAFAVIVASGPNSALPHHHPGERPLQSGDTIIVDMGAELHGYKSDLSRSFYLGDTPSDKFWHVYNLVKLAQQNTLDNLRPGMTTKEGDALAREVIEDAGQAENFGHGLGHGVGIDIHEEPQLTWRTEHPIPAGSIITIEPGIYIPGWGGIRIEDLIHLTENGVTAISQCPYQPVIPIR
jgi:Xaa-Pro aminopeptidase